MTLLVSSHILAELDEYSTHMLSLREGRVLENRALSRAHPAVAVRHLLLQLAQADARLPEWLKNQEQVTLRHTTDNLAGFDFHGDLTDQAALLQALVQAGFAVASFSEQKENLQQSYMQSIALHQAGEA